MEPLTLIIVSIFSSIFICKIIYEKCNITNNLLETTAEISDDLINRSVSIVYIYNNDNIECPICLKDIEKGNLIRQNSCSHIYHKHCLDDWFKIKHICPNCNLDIIIIEN